MWIAQKSITPDQSTLSIKVSLVPGVWLRDVRHLLFIQLHTVQVACWSDWILQRIFSALYTVNKYCGCCRCVFTFHCFPSFCFFFCHFDPCVIVLCFIPFRLFSFFWLEEFIDFVFPSLFWSLHWSVCLVLGAEAWVPFCGFLCPWFVW